MFSAKSARLAFALSSVILCAVVSPRHADGILCGQQLECPAHGYLGVFRKPYYGKSWKVYDVPPGAATAFNGDQSTACQGLCARMINVWTSVNDTLPHDEVGAGEI